MEAIAEFRQVEKHYGNQVVLRDLSFRLTAGEQVAIVGPSGVGKSTVLNLLGGLDVPSAGQIHVFGHPMPRPRSRAATLLLRHRLAYVFQNFALIEDDTVAANLAVPLTYQALTPAMKRTQQQAALAQVGLSAEMLRQKTFALSGGEQQRVALARILLKPCELILADEPTGSLDRNNQQAILNIFRVLKDQGKTIVIVTHSSEVAHACDRQIVLPELP